MVDFQNSNIKYKMLWYDTVDTDVTIDTDDTDDKYDEDEITYD